MHEFPDTRPSLLLRVRDPDDHRAWEEFVAIYRPLVVRLARRRGLQDADSQDLAQAVLAAVAKGIEQWTPDPERARFRSWLTTIARNAIFNQLSRRRPDSAVGGDHPLAEIAVSADDEDELEQERRRELFRWAAKQVRPEFAEPTWRAFWLSTVEGLTVEETAQELEKTIGAVYAARSRVMRRLREKVQGYDDDSHST